MKLEYRNDIYKDYAQAFKGATGTFDMAGAEKFGRSIKYYLRDWLPPDHSAAIIDLGCGDGKMLYALQEKGYQNLTGVDRSQSQVELARQVLKNVHLANVLDFLTEDDTSYDFILAMDLIEHLSKEEVLIFLSLCYSRLADGGRMILQTPNAANPYFGTIRYGDFTHELAFTPVLLGQILNNAGFTQIDLREQTPVPFGYSMLSTLRFTIYQIIRLSRMFVTTIETGSPVSPILSRVFLATGVKSKQREGHCG